MQKKNNMEEEKSEFELESNPTRRKIRNLLDKDKIFTYINPFVRHRLITQ